MESTPKTEIKSETSDSDTSNSSPPERQRLQDAESYFDAVLPVRIEMDDQGMPVPRLQIRYCTHKCLLGLRDDGLFDPDCPNVLSHRQYCAPDRPYEMHPLKYGEFLDLLRRQLTQRPFWGDLPVREEGPETFIVRMSLLSHGYTFMAKSSNKYDEDQLSNEFRNYNKLQRVQGVSVPVCLGLVGVPWEAQEEWKYTARGGVRAVKQLLLLSFAGTELTFATKRLAGTSLLEEAAKCLVSIHRAGIIHSYTSDPSNLLVQSESLSVMLVDFSSARPLPPQVISSTNQVDDGRLPHAALHAFVPLERQDRIRILRELHMDLRALALSFKTRTEDERKFVDGNTVVYSDDDVGKYFEEYKDYV